MINILCPCGKITKSKNYLIRKYCNKQCYTKFQTGISHGHKTSNGHIPWNKGMKLSKHSWNYIEDRTKLKRDNRRNNPLHKEWTKKVKNRDLWKCLMNDKNCSKKIVAHHIIPWRESELLRYEVNNGITLCHFHHPRKRNDEMKLIPVFQELIKVN